MPWVRLDDRFPSHRKIRLLSHQAFRLYVSGLCYASENLTDGYIPASELRIVADVRSGKTAAKELVERGLWQVSPNGGWIIHDYHDYNPTAEQIRADRAAKTERQARWRANKKTKTRQPDDGTGQPPAVDAVDPHVDASTDASRDAPVTPAPSPLPYPVVPPTEEQLASPAGPRHPAAHVPGKCAPLVATLNAAGVIVTWNLEAREWAEIENRIDAYGIPGLVEFILQRRNPDNPPNTGRYLLRMWSDLPLVDAEPISAATAQPPAVAGTNVIRLHAQPLRSTGTDARVAGWLNLPTEED